MQGHATPPARRDPPAGDTDEQLMLRYRDGDAGAFDRLYARYRQPLYRYFLRQCGQPAIAEELFQDVWFRLVRARERYTVQAGFGTYLYRLAHNRLIDHYRSAGRALPRSYQDTGDPLDPDSLAGAPADRPDAQLERLERGQRLLAALSALPEAQREAFLLRQEGGLSVEQIADITGVSREAAKSRLRYAAARLRKMLESDT